MMGGPAVQDIVKGRPIDELHDNTRLAFRFKHVEDRDNIRMLQSLVTPRLILNANLKFWVGD
jgi:hypothetical protein